MGKTYIVDFEDVSFRIDQFLAEKTDLSRSNIQKLIKEAKVLVNGETTKSSYRIEIDDVITLMENEVKTQNVEPEDIKIDIVYEDDDIIVVNKAKGMVVHPANGNYSNTLVNALLFHSKNLSAVNGEFRPGIVHRIDKDTSGLLVCVKNDYAHNFIANQLQDKTCYRKYYALLNGVVEHNNIVVDAPIGRSNKDRQKMCVTDINSKNALTKINVLNRYSKTTLVECQLETGRTHQIRVHSQYIKHPVVNDPKYSNKTIDDKGQVLHAYFLSFIHPKTLERMEFKTPIPDYFNQYIKEYNSDW